MVAQLTPRSVVLIFGFITLCTSCSSSPQRTAEMAAPEISALSGKRVALVSIDGEPAAQKVIAAALVNQVIQNGGFILLSKQEVDTARVAPEQDPADWLGIAKRVGADYALTAEVIQFEAPVRDGVASERTIDSQLKNELGTDGEVDHVFKVKVLDGRVKIQLSFTKLSNGETRSALAAANEHLEMDTRLSTAHLPAPLRFLEKITNRAFREFLEKYQ